MADIINFVDENGVDWRAEVGKVYAKITGDFYDELGGRGDGNSEG